jgi:hypothetical protein
MPCGAFAHRVVRLTVLLVVRLDDSFPFAGLCEVSAGSFGVQLAASFPVRTAEATQRSDGPAVG